MKTILRMTNKDNGFYDVMGPVFGSRKVQRETGDRFYDDDKKEWFVSKDDDGNIISVVSIADGCIKNVYAEDTDAFEDLLANIYKGVGISVVPAVYKDSYIRAGYSLDEGSYKNYVRIKGGVANGESRE